MTGFRLVQPAPHTRAAYYMTTAGSVFAVVCLVFSAWLAGANIQSAGSEAAIADQYWTAQRAAETVISTMKDAETGQRGYLLTGDADYLKPYDDARAHLDGDLAGLETAVLNDPARARRVEHIRELAGTKMSELGQTLALYRAGQAEASLALVRTNLGQRAMEEIRHDVDQLQTDAIARINAAMRKIRSTGGWIGVIGLDVLACALLGWVALTQRNGRMYVAGALLRLERFTRASRLGQAMIRRLDGQITFWSDGNERLYGFSADQAIGHTSHALLRTEFPQPLAEITETLLRDGQWSGELTHHRRDGSPVHVASHWALHRGGSGEPTAVIELNNDVTALKRAGRDMQASNALLRTVIETSPGLIYAKDRQGRIFLANQSALDLIGKPWDQVEGRTDAEFLDTPEQGETIMALDRKVMDENRTHKAEECVGDDPDGTRVWLSTKAPLHDTTGLVTGLVGVSVEITESKRIEQRLRLLVDELNHRVKNTLATVQAIIVKSQRGLDPALTQALNSRILALASVHDLLTQDSWRGAMLSDVVSMVLEPYGADEQRVVLNGPGIRLKPRAVQAVGMGLQELATNAAKYGSLSAAAGRVEVDWCLTGDRDPALRLTWREIGGPPVIAPGRRGFGTWLIERGLAADLGGSTRIDFEPNGLTCVIEAPISEIVAPAVADPLLRLPSYQGT